MTFKTRLIILGSHFSNRFKWINRSAAATTVNPMKQQSRAQLGIRLACFGQSSHRHHTKCDPTMGMQNAVVTAAHEAMSILHGDFFFIVTSNVCDNPLGMAAGDVDFISRPDRHSRSG